MTANNIALGATLANNSTQFNTVSTIVRRDASGDFAARIITASLAGNANTATLAANFGGNLLGDVTGTQSATVVSLVGGQTSTNVAAGVVLANASTNLNTINTIVKRDGSGNFTAGTITATLIGTASSAVAFSGSLVGDVTGTQGATVVSLVGGQTSANVASGVVLANASTSSNTVSTIVRRDGSGDFSAGIITNTTLTISAVINMVNTTSSLLGVINKGGNRFIHNYGTLNTFAGVFSGNFTLTGQANSAFGAATLSSLTTGSFNTAGGWNSLEDNTVGEYNTAYGIGSLQSNINGSYNIGIGPSALGGNTAGINNTAVGMSSLILNTGSDNTTLGFNTGLVLTSGNSNLFLGTLSGSTITTTSNNVCIANVGTLGDSGIIRLGTPGTQLKNFQAGIRGITADANDSTPVYVSSTGQLTSVSTSKASGNMSVTSAGPTTVSANTWTLLTNITTSSALVNFTRPADNRLAYGGAVTSNVLATLCVTISSSAITNLYVAITKNGATPSGTFATQGNIAAAIGINTNFSPCGIFSMATNDYLNVYVFSSSAANISLPYCTLSATTV